MCSSRNNFPIGIRIQEAHRAALERAAALRGQSVAGFVEWLVGRALMSSARKQRSSRY
jgi:uncharacterized protein (DUF1778 family)